MKNAVQVEVYFDRSHKFYIKRKSGIFILQRAFTKPLEENAGATDVQSGFYNDGGDILIIQAQLDDASYTLFQEDYDKFIETIYERTSWDKYGVLRVVVADGAAQYEQLEQYIRENSWY